MREIVLSDKNGNAIGTAEIMDAHTGEGKLHKAFSIYIFKDEKSKILIQKRSVKKMLFAGYWANTCCSHPFPKEDILDAGKRRLKEECGFTCPLSLEGALVYKAKDPNGNGIEHEHDSLLTGDVDDISFVLNPEEIEILEWRNTNKVIEDMKNNPSIYAPWFILGLNKIVGEDNI